MNKKYLIVLLPILYGSIELLQFIALGGILVSRNMYIALICGAIAILCEIAQFTLVSFSIKLGIESVIKKYSIKNKFVNDYGMHDNISYA